MRSPKPSPTRAEVEILEQLFDLGPATVRAVHERSGARRRTGYTTTLKQMQLMLERGLLQRDDEVYPHVYRPAITRRTLRRGLVHQAARGFQGSYGELALQALASRKCTAEELRRIRALIDELEEGT